jgi:hypothetical protein
MLANGVAASAPVARRMLTLMPGLHRSATGPAAPAQPDRR